MSLHKPILFTIALVLSITTFAQVAPPNWEWAKPAWGQHSCIAQDEDGNIYIGGSVNSNPTNGPDSLVLEGKKLPEALRGSVYIIKYTNNGKLLWVRCYGDGKKVLSLININLDKNDNIYISGWHEDSAVIGTHILHANYQAENYLAKLDKYGDVLWTASSQRGNYSRTGYNTGIGIDAEGNAYVCGEFERTASFGTITVPTNNHDLFTGYIVKYDPNGNPVWAKGFTGPGASGAFGITADDWGNVYTTGYCNDSTRFNNTYISTNSQTFFISKHDKDGNLVWVKTGCQDDESLGLNIAIDKNGNAYVGGMINGPVCLDGFTLTNMSQFIVKYNTNGDAEWLKGILTYNPPKYAHSTSITTDKWNNVYLAGHEGFRGYLCKYSPDGNLNWMIRDSLSSKNIIGTIHGVSVNNAGNAYIVADIYAATFSNTSFKPEDGNVVLAKLGMFPAGVEDLEASVSSLRLYPNPANTILTISSKDAFEQVKIHDITGKMVLSKKTTKTKELLIDIEGMVPGVYMLEAGENARTKFVKE